VIAVEMIGDGVSVEVLVDDHLVGLGDEGVEDHGEVASEVGAVGAENAGE
jgi:hypothetical protein